MRHLTHSHTHAIETEYRSENAQAKHEILLGQQLEQRHGNFEDHPQRHDGAKRPGEKESRLRQMRFAEIVRGDQDGGQRDRHHEQTSVTDGGREQ